jgi:hypothetical protein
MRRGTLKSSYLKSVGYDETKKILQVEMRRDGAVLNFEGVPFIVFRRLVMAKSPGDYMQSRIEGQYKFSRV